jgi:hypothetical protein
MAEKKEKKPKAAVVPEDTPPVGAPKSIVKPEAGPTPPKNPKKPKLAKKNKSRLPRKQKKTQQKAARGQIQASKR